MTLAEIRPQNAHGPRRDNPVWVFVASLFLCAMLFSAEAAIEMVWVPVIALLPSYALGVFIGGRLVHRISEAALRRAVLGLVIVVAAAGLLL